MFISIYNNKWYNLPEFDIILSWVYIQTSADLVIMKLNLQYVYLTFNLKNSSMFVKHHTPS